MKEQEKDSPIDCLPCRLVSGFGVIGIGAYIYVQARNKRKLDGAVMKLLAAGN